MKFNHRLSHWSILLLVLFSGCTSVPRGITLPQLAESQRKIINHFAADPAVRFGIILPTRSMLPLFDSDTIVAIKRFDFSTIKSNQLVAFNRDGLIVIHRVKERRSTSWWTKGDSAACYDAEPLTEDTYVGHVVGWCYFQPTERTLVTVRNEVLVDNSRLSTRIRAPLPRN